MVSASKTAPHDFHLMVSILLYWFSNTGWWFVCVAQQKWWYVTLWLAYKRSWLPFWTLSFSLSLSLPPSLNPTVLPTATLPPPFSLNTHSGKSQLPSHQDTPVVMQRGPCGKEGTEVCQHPHEWARKWILWLHLTATPADSSNSHLRRLPAPEPPTAKPLPNSWPSETVWDDKCLLFQDTPYSSWE